MKANKGVKIVNKHGNMCNVLPGLSTYALIQISDLVTRTYEITVPWNVGSIVLPFRKSSVFPKINEEIPSGSVIRKTI